ncbi:PAS domain S-box protein [bacterium]|nr:PAS domain S-box protein [bacterium]
MPKKLPKSGIDGLLYVLKKASKGDYKVRASLSDNMSDLKSLAEGINHFLEHVGQTFRKHEEAEEALRQSEERFRRMFEDSTLGIYRTTPSGKIILVNQAALRMLGYRSFEELAKRNLEETGFEPSYPRDEFKRRLEEEGVIIGLESAWLRKDGSTIYVRESARAVRDTKGNVIFYDGTFEDITERKKTEKRVEKELKEKVLLLKEVHHRVKNNLQIICSLLNLQSYKVQDPEAKIAFQYSKSRIYSMALVHEQLYKSDDFSNIQIKPYIEQLVQEVGRAYRISSSIRISHDIEEITLGIDKAIPCGLILNELITNAVKHAFPEKTRGKINIIFKKKQDTFEITIGDNGIGLPDTFDFSNIRSMGLHMVKVLVRQLNGELTLTGKPGTEFVIRF